ncbi:hypothetical protein [Celerinatantimonas sp. MCCC 1A17872]|uniref:hypothetical protein n=1 Tax=Celerinatantimonas sp. MCCC 1A17872 TaxID=3177514 RepID=UPI0038C4BFBC
MDLEAGFWVRDFEVDQVDSQIIPKVGEQRIVYISLDSEPEKGKKYYVLWFPPYSAINGWDDNPNEIKRTHVVECTLTYLESFPFTDEQINSFVDKWIIAKDKSKYQANILSVTPFLEFCENYEGHDYFSFQRCGYPDGSTKMIWELSREYQKAKFGSNLIYITGCVPEQFFSAVIDVSDSTKCRVKFHEHYDPGIEQCLVINYELKGDELKFFKEAIENAIELKP